MDVTEVLIVDDSPEARFVRRRALAKAGVTVREAGTAAECFAALDERLPQVVVLDVHLPDAHGFDVCRRIKADPRTSHVSVIQVSAAATDPAAQISGLEGGADAYLTEPIDPAVLTATVRAMVRERRIATALRQTSERLGRAQLAGDAGVWELDLASGAAWWSDELAALQGIPSGAERTVEAWIGSLRPADQPLVREAIVALDAGGRLDLEVRLPGTPERFVQLVGGLEPPALLAGLTVDATQRRRARDQLAAIQDLALRVAAEGDPAVIVRETVAAARATIGAEEATLAVVSGGDDVTLTRTGGAGRAAHETVRGALRDPALPVTHLIAADAPLRLPDPAALEAELGAGAAHPSLAGVRALTSVPFHGGDGARGILAVWCLTEWPFTPSDVATLRSLAEVCSQALTRAELLVAEAQARADAQSAAERLALRADLVEHLERERGIAARSARAVRFCVDRLAPAAALFAADGTLLAEACAPASEPLLTCLRPLAGAAPNRPKRHVGDTAATLCVPLAARGERVGLLVLARPADEPFSEVAEQLGSEIMPLLGLVLDNARLDDEQRHIARTLQLSMLEGAVGELPGDVSAALRYLPAVAELEIGGDWHDVVVRDDGRIAAIVGDVVGHGLRASTAMGSLRHAARALVRVLDRPDQVLSELESVLMATGQTTMVTVSCSLLDPRTGELVHASAGHPPPLVVGPDTPPRYLEGGRSIPLAGLRPARESTTAHLAPGDVLLTYTDGLVERRDVPLDDNLARLAQAAAEGVRGGTLAELVDGVLAELLGGRPNADDVAVLAVRRAARPADALSRRVDAEAGALGQLLSDALVWLDGCGSERGTVRDDLRRVLASLPVDHEAELDVELRCADDGVHLAVRTRTRAGATGGREPGGSAVAQRLHALGGTTRAAVAGELVVLTLPLHAAPAAAER